MKKVFFAVWLLLLFMACGCTSNDVADSTGKTEPADPESAKYEAVLVGEKKITGNYGIEKNYYYSDIDAKDDLLYLSFRANNGSSESHKVMLVMDGELKNIGNPIDLMENANSLLYSPDHEVAIGGDFFYVTAEINGGKNILDHKLALQKYDSELKLVKTVYIEKTDPREAANDQALTFYDDKLFVSTYIVDEIGTAGVNARSVLRIFNDDLELLSEHILEPGAKGHVAWDENENKWIIFASDVDDEDYRPGKEEPDAIRLYAFYFDEGFEFTHKVKLSDEKNYKDRYQVYPYGFKSTDQYYMISYRAGHDSPKGENQAELSVFDKNLKHICKIEISDLDTKRYSSFIVRFDTIGDKIYCIYEVEDVMDEQAGNDLYVSIFKTNFLK